MMAPLDPGSRPGTAAMKVRKFSENNGYRTIWLRLWALQNAGYAPTYG